MFDLDHLDMKVTQNGKNVDLRQLSEDEKIQVIEMLIKRVDDELWAQVKEEK